MSDGFLFDSLSELRKNLMLAVKDKYPKETEKFLRQEARKLLKYSRKYAKKNVGTTKGIKRTFDSSKSYHKKFKIGKIYVFGESDKCIRVYNASRHAHLIETGHRQVPRGKKGQSNRGGASNGETWGKYVFYDTQLDFRVEFELDCNDFLYQFVDDTINGKL